MKPRPAFHPDMPGIRVCVDRGGTFTDCIAFVPNSIQPLGVAEGPGFRTVVVKLLSVDPTNYQDAPREGIRRILVANFDLGNSYWTCSS